MTVDPDSVGLISSEGQIEALSNPIRIRILHQARTPITVAELAERFDVPKTRLYYHLNLLVEEGFLTQVDERKSGARIEKIYLRTAANLQLSPDLAEAIGDTRRAAEAAAALIFEPARADTEDVLERRMRGIDQPGVLARSMFRLSADDVARFESRFNDLLSDLRSAHADSGPDADMYSYTVALVPIDDEEES